LRLRGSQRWNDQGKRARREHHASAEAQHAVVCALRELLREKNRHGAQRCRQRRDASADERRPDRGTRLREVDAFEDKQ
jgi:hypothetical protein